MTDSSTVECRSVGNLTTDLHDSIVLLFLGALALFLLIVRPSEVPPLFQDEGWNLTVARNWIELGHYGPLLDGRPIEPEMITTGLPAIVPLALSFRTFGVGTLQARLPGIFFTIGAMILIFYLADRLFERRVAIGTLAILMAMPIRPELHPVFVGRQAMGEMPSLFYLLAGYGFFLARGRGRLCVRFLAPICWGLSLTTKTQVIPFLLLGLAIPLLIAIYKRLWRMAGLFSAGLLGSLVVFGALIWLQMRLLNDPMPTQTHIGTWSSTTAVVPVLSVRIWVLKATLLVGFPVLLGLIHASWKAIVNFREGALTNETGLVRCSLLILTGSWFAWYSLLSIGLLRYLFPAIFLGSIFASAMLFSLTGGFDIWKTLKDAGGVFLRLRFDRHAVVALLVTSAVAWAVLLSAYGLCQAYLSDSDKAPSQAVSYLNTQTPPDVVIESAEAELYFLLNRRYHYAPLEVSIQLLRRRFWGTHEDVEYDPLEADPDYIVVGPMARLLQMYGTSLQGGKFKLVKTIAPYDIYRRER